MSCCHEPARPAPPARRQRRVVEAVEQQVLDRDPAARLEGEAAQGRDQLGDHLALARLIRTCLEKERSGKSFAPTAYSKVLRHYSYERVLPFHVSLAREAVLDHDFAAPPIASS